MAAPKIEIQCSDDAIAKTFASIYFTVLKRGTKANDGSYFIDWIMFKSYARRIFEEPPIRIENATNILVKLKLALFEIGKPPENPKGPDVITKVHFLDLDFVDNFYEFYQYYYFNPGKKLVLNYDDLSINLAECLHEEALKVQADRSGYVHVEFKAIAENYVSKIGSSIVPNHIQSLETRGIFCKMRNIQDIGVIVEYDAKEVFRILGVWKVLREIKKWNAAGFVNPNEVERKAIKRVATSGVCPTCSAPMVADARFCHTCGAKTAS